MRRLCAQACRPLLSAAVPALVWDSPLQRRPVGCVELRPPPLAGVAPSLQRSDPLPFPPEGTPTLILLRGYAGIGKTTVGEALARKLGCAFTSKDDIKDVLITLDDAAKHGVRVEIDAFCYAVVLKVSAKQLQMGLSVVVDTPLGRKELYDAFVAVAAAEGARVVVVHCVLDENSWQQRLARRQAEQEHAAPLYYKPVDCKKNREYYAKTWYDTSPSHTMEMDVSGSPEVLAEQIADRLRQATWNI